MSDLDKSNYYTKEKDQEFMSYSQFCQFRSCEAEALAELKGLWVEPTTKPMLIGSFIDAHFSGESKEFAEKHPEIFKKDGSLLSDFAHALDIIKVIESDPYFFSFYQGDAQVIETGMIAGVPFKIKMDTVTPDRIVDQKVMKDCSDVWTDMGKVPFWKAYGYDVQAAIYQEVHSQNCGRKLPFYLAVATKEDQPDKRIFKFKQQTLDAALAEVIALAPVFQKVKKGEIAVQGCGHCDYCRSVKRTSEKDLEEI